MLIRIYQVSMPAESRRPRALGLLCEIVILSAGFRSCAHNRFLTPAAPLRIRGRANQPSRADNKEGGLSSVTASYAATTGVTRVMRSSSVALALIAWLGQVQSDPLGKRDRYAQSIRDCTLGSREGDVLLMLSEAPGLRRRAADIVASLLARSTADLQDNDPEPETAEAFTLVPVIKAHLHNRTIEQLLDDDTIEFVEADCKIRVSASPQLSPPWGLDRIDSCYPQCGGTTGRDGQYTYSAADGADAFVYVVDTGLRISHTDFGGRAIGGFSSGCATGSESGCSSRGGKWLHQGIITGSGCSDHGTHCASTAAGSTYGVAKGATIVAVQGLDCAGDGYSSDIINSLQWIVNQDRKSVV